MAGIRIGLNGREVSVGQAFANVDVTINDGDYAVEGVQRISPLGTIIPPSVVVVEAKPSHIHTALLLIGARAGNPAMRKPIGHGAGVSAETRAASVVSPGV